MQSTKVSKKILARLPAYLDYLKSLPVSVENVSATTIARALDLGDVLVRKDLAKVSHTGRRKTGRSRAQLIREITEFMNFAAETDTIIVGAGKLGQALLDYSGFGEAGLNIMAAFDSSPKAALSDAGKPIYPMNRLDAFCRRYDIRIGIIAVPAQSAQSVCDCLVSCGVQVIWNFAPVHLNVPEYVAVQNENLAASLASLRQQLKDIIS